MVRARNPSGPGRGGPRDPQPGAQYTNRSDLQSQAPSAVPGQPYGQAGAQLAAQRAIPLPTNNLPPAAPPAANVPQVMGAVNPAVGTALPQPGHFGPLDRPTDRPTESLHTGSPSGPGPGPEVLPGGGVGGPDADLVTRLRALYQLFPTEEFRYMLAKATGGPQ